MANELGWVKVEDDQWEFRQGDVIWGTALRLENGWKALAAFHATGPWSTVGQAMDAVEEYWKAQDVGPLANDDDPTKDDYPK